MKNITFALLLFCIPFLSGLVSVSLYHHTFETLSDSTSYIFTALGTLVAIGTAIPAVTAYFAHQSVKDKYKTFQKEISEYKAKIQDELSIMLQNNKELKRIIEEKEIGQKLNDYLKNNVGILSEVYPLTKQKYTSLHLYYLADAVLAKAALEYQYEQNNFVSILLAKRDTILTYEKLIIADKDYHNQFINEAISLIDMWLASKDENKPYFIEEIVDVFKTLIKQDENDTENAIPNEKLQKISDLYKQFCQEYQIINEMLSKYINQENKKIIKLSRYLGLNSRSNNLKKNNSLFIQHNGVQPYEEN